MITRQAQWQVKPRPTRTGQVGHGQGRPRSPAQNAAYAEGLRAIAANELSRFSTAAARHSTSGITSWPARVLITIRYKRTTSNAKEQFSL